MSYSINYIVSTSKVDHYLKIAGGKASDVCRADVIKAAESAGIKAAADKISILGSESDILHVVSQEAFSPQRNIRATNVSAVLREAEKSGNMFVEAGDSINYVHHATQSSGVVRSVTAGMVTVMNAITKQEHQIEASQVLKVSQMSAGFETSDKASDSDIIRNHLLG